MEFCRKGWEALKTLSFFVGKDYAVTRFDLEKMKKFFITDDFRISRENKRLINKSFVI